jgi:glutamate formiminotransferase/formiminotetrahydrofolate cyclodeaminase
VDTAPALGRESFDRLLERIAERTPTPGGGSVAALAGAMGGALGCMAVRFSTKRKESTPEQDAVLGTLERGLLEVAKQLTALADEDAAAFESVRAARKLPQTTDAERAARAEAIRSATVRSADVPRATAKLCREAMELIDGGLPALNPKLATDAASGAILLRAGARCAAWNVLVNLVGDETPAAIAARTELEKLLARTAELESRASTWTDHALRR